MIAPVLPPLAEWETFYVIIGSSAAALTGLQFVVIALSADVKVGGEAEMQAFATPTIVHFCAVLLVAAIVCTPGQTATSLSVCLSICGITGLAYVGWVVVVQTWRLKSYVPVLEDWIWHSGLPLVAYICLTVAGVTLARRPAAALYVVAATALLLLFIGIHNAWDAALFISAKKKESQEPDPPRAQRPKQRRRGLPPPSGEI